MKTDIFAKGQVGLYRMDLPLENTQSKEPQTSS